MKKYHPKNESIPEAYKEEDSLQINNQVQFQKELDEMENRRAQQNSQDGQDPQTQDKVPQISATLDTSISGTDTSIMRRKKAKKKKKKKKGVNQSVVVESLGLKNEKQGLESIHELAEEQTQSIEKSGSVK